MVLRHGGLMKPVKILFSAQTQSLTSTFPMFQMKPVFSVQMFGFITVFRMFS